MNVTSCRSYSGINFNKAIDQTNFTVTESAKETCLQSYMIYLFTMCKSFLGIICIYILFLLFQFELIHKADMLTWLLHTWTSSDSSRPQNKIGRGFFVFPPALSCLCFSPSVWNNLGLGLKHLAGSIKNNVKFTMHAESLSSCFCCTKYFLPSSAESDTECKQAIDLSGQRQVDGQRHFSFLVTQRKRKLSWRSWTFCLNLHR